MKIITFNSKFSRYVNNIKRRAGWLSYGLSVRKFLNCAASLIAYISSANKMLSYPVFLKIDISPLCNLQCNACVHANPMSCSDEHVRSLLNKQNYSANMKMSYSDYCALIDKIKKYTSAVSLNWLGDPLMHEDLIRMIQYAASNKLSVHITTNFSFKLNQEYIESLIASGLTHLTVAVDGMTQDVYSKTRINGRIELVKSNIERVVNCIKNKKLKYPILELQYLLYEHNKKEYSDFMLWCLEIGVENVAAYGGILSGNFVMYTHHVDRQYSGKNKKMLPYCYWPYFFMVINFNGDVFPCCQYRYDMINDTENSAERIKCGNVFKEDLMDIWNSEKYKIARRIVKNPSKINKDNSDYFCYACGVLYDETKL